MKKGDARRGELLAAAERLFYTKGYEKTSVQDILTEVGCSKGGFYHYFDSKLAVLEAICEQRAQETCTHAQQIAAQAERSAVARLNALFQASALWQSDNPGFVTLLIAVAYREDGALMREKMKRCQLACMQDAVERVLSDGVASGEFFLSDVTASAALLLRLYMQLTDEIAFILAQEDNEERMADAIVSKLRAYRQAIERVLLAPFGSMELFDAKALYLLGSRLLRDRLRRRADAMLGAR